MGKIECKELKVRGAGYGMIVYGCFGKTAYRVLRALHFARSNTSLDCCASDCYVQSIRQGRTK